MKILVVELSNLGDALLTWPALSALWAAHPQAEFHVLASPRTRELFEGDPRIRRVWFWEKRAPIWNQAGVVLRLSLERFGLVVDFRNSLIPLFLLGARRTPMIRASADGAHRSDHHLALVTALGIPPAREPAPLPFGPEETARVKTWIRPDQKVAVLVPGARSHLKRWSAEGFADVADRLAEEQGAQVVLVGEEAERPIAEEVQRLMRRPSVDLVGRTTLRELAALLARSALVVTNDNAVLHAASAMKVPTVAVFGPTDERKYGPRAPGSAVIRRALICAPCELALCPYGHECMKWIEPAEVSSVASKVLGGHV